MDDTCTSRKQYRKEYKRQWIAASRALRQSSSHAITQEHLSDNYNSDVEHHFNHEQEVEDVDSLCSSSFNTCPQLASHEPEEIVSVSDNSFPTIDLEEDDSDLFHFHSITTDIENILDSDEEDFEKDTILANDLAQWVNENSIEHNAVDALLEEHDNEKLPDLSLHVQKQRRLKKRQREERDSDSNDEESVQEPRKKLPAAPKAPIFVPDSDGSRTQNSSPTCRPDESRLISPNRDAHVSRGLNSSPTCRPDQSSQSRFISPNRNVQVSRGLNSSPTCRPDQSSVVTPNRDVSKRQDSAYRPVPSTSGRSRQDSSCNCQTVIVQKLRTLEDGIKEIKTAISQLAATGHGGVVATSIVEDVIQHPINYIHEMRDLEDKMKDDHFKNKLVQYLVSQGGHSRSDCIRRMMKKCGTNQLWAKYSLKGQNGKEAFTGHPLCRIVMKCCARVFPKSKVSDMEEVLIDFLKQAPHKPGGPKYKKPARKGQTITQDELESE